LPRKKEEHVISEGKSEDEDDKEQIREVVKKLLAVQHKSPGTYVDLNTSTIHLIISKSLKIIKS